MVYFNSEEYEFFEKKRFAKDEIPSWQDISFLFKTNVLNKFANKIKNKNDKLPTDIWKILQNILYYRDEEIVNIPNLRREAMANVSAIKGYMEKRRYYAF